MQIITSAARKLAAAAKALGNCVGEIFILIALLSIVLRGRAAENINSFLGLIQAMGWGQTLAIAFTCVIIASLGVVVFHTLTVDVDRRDERGWY